MSNKLAASAAIILAVTMVGRLLGLVRDSVLASMYGLSMEQDVYQTIGAGYLLTLFMVIPGAFNAVYIPVMSKFLQGEKLAERNQLFQRLSTLVLLAFLVLVLCLYGLAPAIIRLLQPGYTDEKLALAIQLFRLILPAVFIMGPIGLWMSVHYSHQRFFVPSLGTVIFSVTVIVSTFLLAPWYGVTGITLGTVLGYFIFAALLFVSVRRQNYRFGWRIDWRNDAELKRMGELFFPIFFGMVISQAYFYVNQALASTIADGAQAAFMLAQKLYQLPTAIFVGAFTVPLLPILTDLVKQDKLLEMKGILRKGMGYMHILMLPTMVALMTVGDLFLAVLFERGEFTAADTAKTQWALIFLALALYPMAIRDLITRSFYALEDTRTPVLVGVMSIMVNFVVAFSLLKSLEQGALGLGYSVAITFDMLLLLFLLKRKIGKVLDGHYLLSFAKAFVSSLLMGVVIWATYTWWLIELSKYLSACLIVLEGAVVYYLLLVLFREERVAEVKAMIVRKLKR